MFEGVEGAEQVEESAADLLERALARLQAEVPAELPGAVALERLRALTVCAERLQAVRLAAVRDLDVRELYALDGAGSTRGWLRTLLGGDDGQLSLARRLVRRPHVEAAHAQAQIATKAAARVCTALEAVPAEVDDAQLCGVLRDGVGGLLRQYGGGTAHGTDAEAALRAQQADDLALLERCCRDVTASPAQRLEPAFVLLARRLSAGLLGWALRALVDPLLPDGNDQADADPYYLELRPLLDGDVDVRGHLDAETGQGLAAEIERRMALRSAADDRAATDDPSAADDAGSHGPVPAARAEAGDGKCGPEGCGVPVEEDSAPPLESDGVDGWDVALGPAERSGARARGPRGRTAGPLPLLSAGRRHVDALKALLHDLADVVPGSGRPRPASLTIVATLEAVEGRLGALPGMLATAGLPAPLRTATLQRLGCHSDLDVVLLDAAGNPVGASSTRRSASRRERRALQAQWGPICAVRGCRSTSTVPHHVFPWWPCHRTRLRDLVPLCEHCHRDLHEGHRRLRLRDGRHIDEHGWVASRPADAATAA